MAFCGNCGSQLAGKERFCSNCGKEVGSGTPMAAVAPAAVVGGAAGGPMVQPVQTIGAIPAGYVAPGPIPVAVAVPAPAPAKKGMKFSTLIVVAAIAAGGYYYYTHDYVKDHTPAASQGQGGAAAALGKQQAFDAHWQTANGFVELSNGRWTNNASVAVQSATLQCDQYDSNGNDLDQMRTTLNGPVQPGGTDTFDPFSVGAVASNLDQVKCTITYARPVGQ